MPPLLADGAGFLSFLIYLVIAVIWIFGRISQQKQARRKVEELKRRREEREREQQRTGRPAPEKTYTPTPPPPPSRARTMEDELQDFLGRLAGLEPEQVKPAPAPKPAAPTPPPLPKKAAPPPPPAPTPAVAAAPALRDIPELNTESVYARIKDIEDIADIAEISDVMQQASSLTNVRTLMVDMSNTNLRVPTIHIPSMREVSTKTSKPNLRRPGAIRQALVSGILLSPPKSLQADPFHSDPGQL